MRTRKNNRKWNTKKDIIETKEEFEEKAVKGEGMNGDGGSLGLVHLACLRTRRQDE